MKKAAVFVAVALIALANGSTAGAKEIKIGLITPLSGDVKTFGESVRNAFDIAVSEANAAGGLAGHGRGMRSVHSQQVGEGCNINRVIAGGIELKAVAAEEKEG